MVVFVEIIETTVQGNKWFASVLVELSLDGDDFLANGGIGFQKESDVKFSFGSQKMQNGRVVAPPDPSHPPTQHSPHTLNMSIFIVILITWLRVSVVSSSSSFAAVCPRLFICICVCCSSHQLDWIIPPGGRGCLLIFKLDALRPLLTLRTPALEPWPGFNTNLAIKSWMRSTSNAEIKLLK